MAVPTWQDRMSGVVFVVLALASSAAISLPGSGDSPERIRTLYAAHRAPYFAAQLVGLLGVAAMVRFLMGLRTWPPTGGASVRVTGWLVVLAAVGTNVSVLVLCLAPRLDDIELMRAARATEVTDDALFAAFALFAAVLAVCRLTGWLRVWLGVAALLCALRALAMPVPGLEVAAPVLVLGALLLLALTGARRTGHG